MKINESKTVNTKTISIKLHSLNYEDKKIIIAITTTKIIIKIIMVKI